MNGSRRTLKVTSVIAAGLAITLGLTSPAVAQQAEPGYVETDAIVDSSAIQSLALRGDVLRAKAALTVNGLDAKAAEQQVRTQRVSRKVAAYIDAQAKQGQYLDESQVFAASMDNPILPGRPITVVWSAGTAPEGIHLHKADAGKGNITLGFNLATTARSPIGGQRMGPVAGAGTSGSSGFTGVEAHPNMYKEAPAQPCTTYWFAPEFPTATDANGDPTDHQMNSCWEIWAQDKTVHFEYNRWAVWTLARPASSTFRVWTQDFSILSRPWKNSTAISALVDSTYPSGQSTCDTKATVTIGGTYAGLTGQISIPVYQCTTTWRHFDTGSKMFGMDWDGYTENRQLRLDAAGKYEAVNVTVLPVWADQTYVSTHSCGTEAVFHTCFSFPADRGWKFQDTGW